MLKVVEAFSGIGSQTQALKNAEIEHTVSAIIEWDVGAMYAYDILHNGPQKLKDYRHHTKNSLAKELSRFNISTDGKSEVSEETLSKMPTVQLKSIYASIERNNNLVDISSVKAEDLPDDIDVLTYSFPCQDLSTGSHWHSNFSGIEKDADNRSGLLWQVERLLKDYCNISKEPPKFLLMENVSAITSKLHNDNFQIWKSFLEKLGYVNQVYTLNAKNFGIPQSRKRTYMISVLVKDDIEKKDEIQKFFFENNLENVYREDNKICPIKDYLKLDYSDFIYKKEAMESTPNHTPSREKIYNMNKILATDSIANKHVVANTITTKQDRHPNSGIIEYKDIDLVEGAKYRNLTPRECFLLMGFSEKSYNILLENNISITKSRKMLSFSKLYMLSGNSIVVPVLEEVFKQINTINEEILKSNKTLVKDKKQPTQISL